MLEFLYYISQYLFLFVLHICHNETFPKPLSKDEEDIYLKQVALGDIKARNKLVEHNLRLVAHIIKKYYHCISDQDDLVSIGTIGLIKAINTYNPDKKIKLSSYASRCIENEILMHFRNCKKTAQDVSLNDAIDTDKDGNPLTLMDIMSVDDDIIENIDTKINLEKLYTYLDEVLSNREKEIIVMRFGLNDTSPLTQREIAKKLNISRSYVSRIEKKALQQLRKKYEKG
ncbi:MAG: sigma-70 family RNA polymerase sigma factor [Ruminococcaceae bacterium]|nr:sigma-70 family RNA polymerase sigma factor [Oscillospiraceae bacterium]